MSNENDTAWGNRCSMAAGTNQPSPALLTALDILQLEGKVKLPGFAIDLGCGLGRDTKHLLQNDWDVLSVDSNAYVLEKLQASVADDLTTLRTQIATFENTDWRPATLINASFALPYCPREQFGFVWSQILASLIPEGLFVGDFFCLMPDEPLTEPMVAVYSSEQLGHFLSPLEVVLLQKWHGDFVNANDEQVKRLVYTVIARRKRY